MESAEGEARWVGVFPFRNTGDSAVVVTSVRPGCGCTTAELGKTRYEPGESGEIVVTFVPGDRVGPQVKQVVVRTDDPEQPVVTLTLRVDLKPKYELEPRLALWQAGEAREPKELVLTIHGSGVEEEGFEPPSFPHPDDEGLGDSRGPEVVSLRSSVVREGGRSGAVPRRG